MPKKWKLDPKEVSRGFDQMSATSLSGGKPFNRKNQLRTYGLILFHIPTSVKVNKTLGPAQHSKKKWDELIDQAYDDLFPELEKKVARHLKIPGV